MTRNCGELEREVLASRATRTRVRDALRLFDLADPVDAVDDCRLVLAVLEERLQHLQDEGEKT